MAMISILVTVLVPIFILIGLGYILHIKFDLHLGTLAKLNIYVFVPGFIFVKFYKTTLNPSLLLYIAVFFGLYVLVLYLIVKVLSAVLKLNSAKATTLNNSVLFFNSGNYGAPVNDIVFKGGRVSDVSAGYCPDVAESLHFHLWHICDSVRAGREVKSVAWLFQDADSLCVSSGHHL